MNRLFSFTVIVALAIALCLTPAPAAAQTATTQTTLPNAITANQNTLVVASATNVTALGSNNQIQTLLVIDSEAMAVTAVSGTTVTVIRGYSGTYQHSHNASAVVWVGPPGGGLTGASPFFFDTDEAGQARGSCTSTNELYLPRVYVPSGNVVDCIASGPGGKSVWSIRYTGTPNSFTDGAFWVGPGACNSSVSGNATGTNGLTVAGASNTPVIQADTSVTGTNTHTYVCTINVPSRLVTGRGIQINDVVFFYGVQSSGLGTQVATLASGTMNSSLVFSKIAYPTAAASETASTVTPVRADSGTLVITPVVASANTSTTTAGGFYSVKFAPASPITVNADLQQLLLTVTLQCAATSATITNSPGFLVHYTNTPL